MSEAVSTASDWLQGCRVTWLPQGAKFLSIIFTLSALIYNAKLTGKRKICCSVTSLSFHFFSICIWLLEQKWLFLEAWGENRNHQDSTILLNHSFALPGWFIWLSWWERDKLPQEVGSLSLLLHLMEIHFCVHGRCHFLQEGKESPI